MPDLKVDLLNKLKNDVFFEEIELVRLAQDPNMNYKMKISDLGGVLMNIAILNTQLGLVEQYFSEPQEGTPPVVAEPPVVVEPPASVPKDGQSHGEG